jgi:CheY-like chemotaxis protein
MHGGRITAQSRGLGKGSCFTVELSTIGSGTDAAGCQSNESSAGQGHAKPVRILLVDDHRDTLKVMQRLLEACGHHVEVAMSVADAARAARETVFDLLISDIGLPDGTGLDVIQAVRVTNPGLPGIALTGYGMEQDHRSSIAAGFAAHLTKPVDLGCLENTIRQLTSAEVRP